MRNLKEVSKHFLRLVAEADREKNTERSIEIHGGRTIYFWKAEVFAKKLGLDYSDLKQVVTYLGARDLLYWRHHYPPHVLTVELTDRGYRWEYHESLFDSDDIDPKPVMPEPHKSIVIHGGTFINSPIDSAGATVTSYIERLRIDQSTSKEERELKELLLDVRRRIDEETALKSFERESATTDLEGLTDQLTKPETEREPGIIEHYLGRIKQVAESSAEITSAIARVAQFLGLNQ